MDTNILTSTSQLWRNYYSMMLWLDYTLKAPAHAKTQSTIDDIARRTVSEQWQSNTHSVPEDRQTSKERYRYQFSNTLARHMEANKESVSPRCFVVTVSEFGFQRYLLFGCEVVLCTSIFSMEFKFFGSSFVS